MKEPNSSRSEQQRPKIAARPLRSFFSNPAVGIVGSIASIVGVCLAVYFYIQAKEYPELTYHVNPASAVLVKSGQLSRLKTMFDNKVIDSDITAYQVAIWNEGKRPIKKDMILKPITIETQNGAPVLEATLRRASRDVTGFNINSDESQSGRIA